MRALIIHDMWEDAILLLEIDRRNVSCYYFHDVNDPVFLGLLSASCVILEKSLHISEEHIPHFCSEEI